MTSLTRPPNRSRPLMATAAAVAIAAALLWWRLLAAWWCDDRGNVALAQGDHAVARAWFERGLSFAPRSRLLLEDRGRARIDADPAGALADFIAAGCGQACTAQRGDAEARLGRADAAVADFLAAKAAGRIAETVADMAAAHRFADALALERALIGRLDPLLDQADVAAARAQIGDLDVKTAKAEPALSAAYRRDAIESFAEASRLAPLNEGYLLSLAYSEMQWGDRRAARRAFERELSLHPTQPDAERGLAILGKER